MPSPPSPPPASYLAEDISNCNELAHVSNDFNIKRRCRWIRLRRSNKQENSRIHLCSFQLHRTEAMKLCLNREAEAFWVGVELFTRISLEMKSFSSFLKKGSEALFCTQCSCSRSQSNLWWWSSRLGESRWAEEWRSNNGVKRWERKNIFQSMGLTSARLVPFNFVGRSIFYVSNSCFETGGQSHGAMRVEKSKQRGGMYAIMSKPKRRKKGQFLQEKPIWRFIWLQWFMSRRFYCLFFPPRPRKSLGFVSLKNDYMARPVLDCNLLRFRGRKLPFPLH